MIDNSTMASYLYFKQIHVLLAWVSLAGFVVRGIWMAVGSSLLEHRAVRILPHLVDTLLLASAVAMLWMLAPNVPGWLYVKVPGVLIYIVLGSLALKRAPSRKLRLLFLVAALAVFAWVASVAITKSPWGYLTLVL